MSGDGNNFEMGAPPAQGGHHSNGGGGGYGSNLDGSAHQRQSEAPAAPPQQTTQPGLNRFREAAQGNYESAQQKAQERAALEREAALNAQAKATSLAQDSHEQAQATKQLGQDMRSEMDGGGDGGLPPAALDHTAANNLQRVQGQFAANKEMMARNRDAFNHAGDEAKARMDEAAGMGRQALETAAAATVDMARGEFEARCAKVAEEEGRLHAVAAEIEKREKQLDMLRNRGAPNWPCACCCFSYMIHHDILGDIPKERQGFMKRLYTNWFCTIFLLIANLGVAITCFVIEPDEKNQQNPNIKEMETLWLQHLVVSGIYLMGIPFSFMLWYWPSYKGVGSGSSSQYTLAKIGFAIGMLFDLHMIVGVTGFGGCGLLYAVGIRNTKHQNASISAFVLAALYICQFISFIFHYLSVRKFAKEDASALTKVMSTVKDAGLL